jgi:hypothetical protein
MGIDTALRTMTSLLSDEQKARLRQSGSKAFFDCFQTIFGATGLDTAAKTCDATGVLKAEFSVTRTRRLRIIRSSQKRRIQIEASSLPRHLQELPAMRQTIAVFERCEMAGGLSLMTTGSLV